MLARHKNTATRNRLPTNPSNQLTHTHARARRASRTFPRALDVPAYMTSEAVEAPFANTKQAVSVASLCLLRAQVYARTKSTMSRCRRARVRRVREEEPVRRSFVDRGRRPRDRGDALDYGLGP